MAAQKKKNAKKKKKPQGRQNEKVRKPLPNWVREGISIVLVGCGIFVFLSLVSYTPEKDPSFFHEISPKSKDVKNIGGPVGSYTASFLKETIGLASYFVGALFLVAALLVFRAKNVRLAPWKIPIGILILICIASLFSLLLPDRPDPEQGGIFGHWISSWLLESLHPAGSYLLLILILLLSIIAIGETALLKPCIKYSVAFLRMARNGFIVLFREMGKLLQVIRAQIEKQSRKVFHYLNDSRKSLLESFKQWRERKAEGVVIHNSTAAATVPAIPEPGLEKTKAEVPGLKHEGKDGAGAPKIVDPPGEGKPGAADDPHEKRMRKARQGTLPFPTPLPQGYRPPPLELLDDPDLTKIPVDQEGLLKGATTLEEKLSNFGIQGKITEIHPGPIITSFEYEPAPGIKVNRIVNLSDDLALATKAMSVRIVAPIPGKAAVGIEVPNPKRQMVYLKEVLASKTFQHGKQKLPLALGKDIEGKPVSADLSRMPHLLIAGATGTGKSVCLHSLILSLLFRFSPAEVKFLMIDPKMLELSAYHGIPHLMHPVITDAKRAQDALDWIVERMEQRYQLLAEKGVRNIDKYNEKIAMEQAAQQNKPLSEEEEGLRELAEVEGVGDESMPEQGKLPYIILIIDEMADLMIVSGRQIEESITRLAQMARAAGIHLLLATQRPSVDVLTGIIKANLPTRISFQVSSRIDSRTILDSMGAEKLLGMGDMLFIPPGTSKIQRIHGAYITEPEIEKIVEYMKQFGKPNYEKIPYRAKKSSKNKEEAIVFEDDEKYDLAVQLVTESRQASISMIQRKLRVGYNRAARMIERMEEEGIVGPQEGVKAREVLANNLK